jgi:predicted GNAT family acetyltransferase
VLTKPIGAIVSVQHDVEHHRFVAQAPGGEAQLIYSYFDEAILNLEHTEVPAAARGHGVADELIRAALAYARERNLNVIATCPFAQRWLASHPDERPRLRTSS